ncbi:hypothetical protein ES705_08206 [subsurface metagenome]
MEKKMIFRDEAAVESWKKQRDIQNQDIMEFARQLNENNLSFNKEIFLRFLKEGTGYVWMLLRGQLEKDIERMKITSEIAKANLLKGIKEQSLKFENVHKKISDGLTTCQIQANEITISQGKAILTKEELEKKRQELSVFVETEVQFELYRLQENLSKSLNDLELFLKEYKQESIFAGGSPSNLNDYVFWEKNSKVKITETEQRFGAGMPLRGGMICKPNPDAIQTLG